MGLRKNNFQGHDSRIVKHGHWLKKKTYINTGFRQVPDLTAEEKRKQIEEKLKPYSLDLTKHVPLEAAHGGTDSFAPPTPSYSVSISPTSVEEFSNVVLSATTDLTSPSFVWTLNNFRDTSGNTVSSYTGNPLTEGYFTSTGSSNVSVVATGDEGSATGSTFSVTAFGNIVDEISGNTWSFSTRQLSTSATNSIRVRRSSDNTEQDIGFSNGLLDTTSLLSFVGTGGTDYGYVVKYYDQSGNNYDMTQTTAADQPTIVSGGTVIQQNNQPTLWIDEPDYMFNSSLSLTGQNMVGFYIARLDITSRGNGALIGSNNYKFDSKPGQDQIRNGLPGVINTLATSYHIAQLVQGTLVRKPGDSRKYYSGIQSGATNTETLVGYDLTDVNYVMIGRRQDGGDKMTGWNTEIIGYNRELTDAEKQSIEREQITYYNIL